MSRGKAKRKLIQLAANRNKQKTNLNSNLYKIKS